MPFKDGTGPLGMGPGRGAGRGRGRGVGRGKMGGTNQGAGPGGFCICPVCGEKIQHQTGVPCYSVNCPECGARMVRG